MLQLAWPWIAATLFAPMAVAWLMPPAPLRGDAALRIPFYRLASSWPSGGAAAGLRSTSVVALLAWACLVAAACRPQWVDDPIALPVTGRDLLLAVDISGSMKTADLRRGSYRLSRLQVVKEIAGDFVERRDGDRVGLILFGSRAYLQTPLTFDRHTVRTLLDEALIGLAGEQTAIGDAIGLAVKRLRERPEGNRVLILLTDGASTAGEIAPEKAAELAALEGIKIYAIGVGAEDRGSTLFGHSSDGLDEGTLEHMSQITGGRYFRARDVNELEEIYALVDKLEPLGEDEEMLRPTTELFHWPLASALGLAAGLIVHLLWAARVTRMRERLRTSGATPSANTQGHRNG